MPRSRLSDATPVTRPTSAKPDPAPMMVSPIGWKTVIAMPALVIAIPVRIMRFSVMRRRPQISEVTIVPK